MKRRSFFTACSGALLAGCSRGWRIGATEAAASARLRARPATAGGSEQPGVHSLQLRRERDALLYIPQSAPADRPAPLVLYLHGATGSEQQGINKLKPFADELGFLLLSPASSEHTWDALIDGYGDDVGTLDKALTKSFAARRVDPKRIAVSGFSDGASYALGLGLSNGDLFSAVLAFSPGFIPPGGAPLGKPRFFISHGTADTILPIANCSRRIVPELKRDGYTVDYHEFEGPHTVPPDMAVQALRWFLA